MDCSVYKEHKHSVAYGTLLNSCSFNTTYLEPKFFHLVLQLRWINAIIGRDSHDSTLLHKLTGSHVAYRTHMAISIFIWIKISKFSIKIWIFSGLLLFSALLLMAHQGPRWYQTFKVPPMLQKTAHVAYGSKSSQSHGHFTRKILYYCWG